MSPIIRVFTPDQLVFEETSMVQHDHATDPDHPDIPPADPSAQEQAILALFRAKADTLKTAADQKLIRGVQGWMALDLHRALGRPDDRATDHQGHGSWADWWADLIAGVRTATPAGRCGRALSTGQPCPDHPEPATATPRALYLTPGLATLAEDIDRERQRYHAVWGDEHLDRHADGTSNDPTSRVMRESARVLCDLAAEHGNLTWARILEVEHSAVLAETDPVRLRTELVKLGAVVAAWAYDLDRRTATEQTGGTQ
ncbi:hypothetical protein [Streptomyces sp. CAU 1734]|uniref:hypothetical protein n=1 Tax=Streptomyces sp. CAU 1734 TaxID=3140360 RepID=UPI0032602F94